MSKLLTVLKSVKEESLQPATCAVAKWLNSLDKEEASAFLDCMNVPGLSAAGLYNAIVAQGIDLPFKATLFRTHVKGYCTCQNK